MTIAIPIETDGHISGHLGKAPWIAILGPTGETGRLENPMDAQTCSGRCSLLEALEGAGVTHLLVRHIGQRTLGRFLRAGLKVYRLPPRTHALPADDRLPPGSCELTEAWQGRPSTSPAGHHDVHTGCGCHGGCHGSGHDDHPGGGDDTPGSPPADA